MLTVYLNGGPIIELKDVGEHTIVSAETRIPEAVRRIKMFKDAPKLSFTK
jgi:hypothetical protein